MPAQAERDVIFRKRLNTFVREAQRIHKGHVEALHRVRVASRQLRELLPLRELDRGASRKLSQRLRKVTTQLGTVRDLDVLTVLIEELRRDRRYSSSALKLVGSAAADARTVARKRLATKLPLERIERLAARLRRVSRHLKSPALELRVTHRAAGVREAVEAAGAVYAPDRLHAVRIAVKKLRYTVDLSAQPPYPQAKADFATLKTAQDLLGRLHDLEALINWTRGLQASLSPPDLVTWHRLGLLVHALEDDCRRLHARYMNDRAMFLAVADGMCARSPLVSSYADSMVG